MMDDVVIKVEHLSKRYRIGKREQMHDTFVGAALSSLRKPLQNLRSLQRLTQFDPAEDEEDVIWALKDVSFEVKRGEILGIIGRNGAGKSTLLKILSRITHPTEGRVEIKGRVSSLLEVGTGFHRELTGRENIYLNGAILGMTKGEIDRKFDEIVDFSGVEKFIDTPVKHYSSGMYVRLAFAVAAHLEPEILLVDEVLAVGDAEFQKKCLGKMGEVAEGGRTVLFVSHNMGAIRNLCRKTVVFVEGEALKIGDTKNIISYYLNELTSVVEHLSISKGIESLPYDSVFKLEDVEISQNGVPGNVVLNGMPISIKICYQVKKYVVGLRIYIDILDLDGNILIRTFHDDAGNAISRIETGRYISKAFIPPNLLSPINYRLCIRATIHNKRSCTGDGLYIPLLVGSSNKINVGYPNDRIRSKIQPEIKWTNHICSS